MYQIMLQFILNRVIVNRVTGIISFDKRQAAWAMIATIFTLLLPLAISVYLLNATLSAQFLEKFFSSGFEYTVLRAALLILGFSIRGWIGKAITLTVTITIFLLPLIAVWEQVGLLYGTAIGGLLPWNDANGYYIDAAALLDGYPIGWSARRPLFVGLLATLLNFTGANLSVCIPMLVALTAIGTFFLAQEINQVYGPIPGAAVTILALFFYKHIGIGTTLTENLGLTMGATSLAIMYAAIRRTSKPMMLAGLYFMTLALCTRPGTFFVLPCLIIAGAVIFKADQKINWRFLAQGIGASMSGFVTNYLLVKQISRGIGHAPFSEFSYILYGVVVGGKGWTQVLIDHPRAGEGTEIYRLALAHFRAHPFDLVRGMIKMWSEYLPGHYFHAYHFIEFGNSNILTRHIHSLIYILLVAGLIWCVVNIKQGQGQGLFLLAAFTGYFASIPFTPSIDGGLRVYAATVAILFILPAAGIYWLLGLFQRLLRRRWAIQLHRDYSMPDRGYSTRLVGNLQVLFALLLAAMAVVGPIVIKSNARPPSISRVDCLPAQEDVYFRYNPGSSISIVDRDADRGPSRSGLATLATIQSEIGKMELKGDADAFSAGQTILTTYNLVDKQFLLVTLPASLVPPQRSIVSACGRWTTDKTARQFGLFHVDNVRVSPVAE